MTTANTDPSNFFPAPQADFPDRVPTFTEIDTSKQGVFDAERVNQPTSDPANLKGALTNFEAPDSEQQQRIVNERGPGVLDKAKNAAKYALATAGVITVGVGAAYLAPKAGEELYDIMSKSDPIEQTLTPEQMQNVIDNGNDTQPEVPGIQR